MIDLPQQHPCVARDLVIRKFNLNRALEFRFRLPRIPIDTIPTESNVTGREADVVELAVVEATVVFRISLWGGEVTWIAAPVVLNLRLLLWVNRRLVVNSRRFRLASVVARREMLNPASPFEKASMMLRITIRCQSDDRREQYRSQQLAGKSASDAFEDKHEFTFLVAWNIDMSGRTFIRERTIRSTCSTRLVNGRLSI